MIGLQSEVPTLGGLPPTPPHDTASLGVPAQRGSALVRRRRRASLVQWNQKVISVPIRICCNLFKTVNRVVSDTGTSALSLSIDSFIYIGRNSLSTLLAICLLPAGLENRCHSDRIISLIGIFRSLRRQSPGDDSVREKQKRILKGLVGKRKEKEKGENSGKQIFYHLRIEGRPQIFPYPSSSLIFRAER